FIVADQRTSHNLIAVFALDEETHTSTGVGSYTSYTPQTSYSSGYVGGTYYYGSTTTSTPVTNVYTYTDVYTFKKIYLNIEGWKDGKERSEIVWSGFLSADIDDYHAKADCMIDVLTQLIGKNIRGDIEIDKYCAKAPNQ
ncbi:MAG: hypothetical protein LBN32_01370, partial [Helicobacteraceae bacterium]|nr:hypothetical protein [Helicobacteraceae bacterium]